MPPIITPSLERTSTPPTPGVRLGSAGGGWLERGGATETVEGDWDPKRLVIIRFDTVARAKEWYYSPEYEGPKALRHRAANTQLTFVEGA